MEEARKVEPIFTITPKPEKARKERRRKIAVNAVLNGIIITSLVYIGMVYGPFLYHEANYYLRRFFHKTYILSEDANPDGPQPAGSVFSSILQGVPEITIEPQSREYGIIIEKIGVNEKVVAEVDPTDKAAYRAALKDGVAHAKGTAFPGDVGNVYLFSHSTANVWDIVRYKSYFTLLRKLEPGDRVVMFYEGNRYDYVIYERKIIDPSETGDLTGFAATPTLTLQTCEPPGSDAKRLVLKANLVGYELD